MISADLKQAVQRVKALSPTWRFDGGYQASSESRVEQGASLVSEIPNSGGHLYIYLAGRDNRPTHEEIARIRDVCYVNWWSKLFVKQYPGPPGTAQYDTPSILIFSAKHEVQYVVRDHSLVMKGEPPQDLVFLFEFVVETSRPLVESAIAEYKRREAAHQETARRAKNRFWSDPT